MGKRLIAEEFKNFISDVPRTLSLFMPNIQSRDYIECNSIFKIAESNRSVFWTPVTEYELKRLITNLAGGESPGYEEVSSVLVKNTAKILVYVFNKQNIHCLMEYKSQ